MLIHKPLSHKKVLPKQDFITIKKSLFLFFLTAYAATLFSQTRLKYSQNHVIDADLYFLAIKVHLCKF